VPRTDPLLDRLLVQRVALMAAVTVAACFGWFAWRLGGGADVTVVRTETFTLLAMCQWFNVLNCQSVTRTSLGPALLRNQWLLGGLALSVALQLSVLYVPVMNATLHTVPLPGPTLLLLAGLASSVLWAEELRKLFARR
jgi:magnesium-transporting ATPase (P-type)